VREALHGRRPQDTFRIVDAHAHAGPYSLFFIPRNDPDAMIEVMDRCGVHAAILSAHRGIQLDAAGGNAETARIVDRYPSRLFGYFVVNPWQDPVGEISRYIDDPRFVGIKVHPDLHHYPMDGPRYDAVWEFAETTGRPVLTHSWLGSDFNDLSHIRAVATRHPLANILAGHSGVLREGIDAAITLARHHPKVFLEICGSQGHGAVVTRMVGELGAGQVVYGSDFPFIDMRISLGRMVFADLRHEEAAMVLGGNIGKLVPRLSAASP
jgi:hypothetical protein